MKLNRNLGWLAAFALALGALAWLVVVQPAAMQETATVEGVVLELGTNNPVSGATVRQQTTTIATTTNADGAFTLTGVPSDTEIVVAAWHEGYLVGGASVTPPQTGVTIYLTLHYTEDNPDYMWFSSIDPDHSMSCVHCMVGGAQWRVNAHANSATSPRFFSMYNGTDLSVTGVVSPGYKLDYPDAAGNCAACHAPAAAIAGMTTPIEPPATITGTFTADMNDVTGVEAEGSFCEFCHKIGEVYLDVDGLPFDNAPGVRSMRMYRSPPGHVLWFGPFDDVTRRVSFLPLEKKSQFCAPCHQFDFHGTPIYQSFKEWLASPYPAQGIECQTCHMAPTGVDYFVFPERGGLIRDPNLIASHLQPGASDVDLLQNTVEMTVETRQVKGSLQVTTTITNTEAGHHVPTDHPGRHMILVVTVTDGLGQVLAQQSGPTVPNWGGEQAGLPGTAFTKVLRDVETGESPVISYWKPTTIASDNRIAALDSDTSTYAFALPAAGGPVTVTAELRFRRLFQPLLDEKEWDTPDIIMEERKVEFTAQGFRQFFLPLIWKGN